MIAPIPVSYVWRREGSNLRLLHPRPAVPAAGRRKQGCNVLGFPETPPDLLSMNSVSVNCLVELVRKWEGSTMRWLSMRADLKVIASRVLRVALGQDSGVFELPFE